MHTTLWSVLVVLMMISGRVFSTCFQGTTTSCAFQCHCSGWCDQNRSEHSGGCQNGCTKGGANDQFHWEGDGCQWGNLALAARTTYQTGDNTRGPGRATDGDTSRVMPSQTFSLSVRDSGGLLWRVHLEYKAFVIRHVTLYTVNTYENTVRGVDIYVSSANRYREEDRCGTQSGTTIPITTITCRQLMKGSYVYVVQRNSDVTELALAEVEVHGYEHYACQDYFDGDYWYGPGCLRRCNCHTQCDDITGACLGDCFDGYVKVSEFEDRRQLEHHEALQRILCHMFT